MTGVTARYDIVSPKYSTVLTPFPERLQDILSKRFAEKNFMKMFNGCLGRSLLILLGLGLIFWGLWSWFAPTAVVRYRLDVTLEVDGKPVTGSVVQELVASTWPLHLPGNARVGYQLYGQALRVNLADRGVLYVLMERYCPGSSTWGQCKGQYKHLIPDVCDVKVKHEWRNTESFATYVRRFKHLTGSCEISEENLPIMVRLDDEMEQTSAKLVLPDTLADAFGGNVRLVSASVIFTDEPISTGIEELLPWLKSSDPVAIPISITDGDGTVRPFFPKSSYSRNFR